MKKLILLILLVFGTFGYAGELWNIDHEENDLSEYDHTDTDSGDMSVNADAAMAGSSYGCRYRIDDQTTINGEKNQTDPDSGDIRIRFYIDPNGLTMGEFEQFVVFKMFCAGVSPYSVASVNIQWSGSDFVFRCTAYNDAGSISVDSETITDAAHYVEIYVHQAATNESADGSVEWWIDGESKGSWASVDNYDIFEALNNIYIGASEGIDAGTSGVFFMDEILCNDTGDAIGAHSEGGNVVPIIVNTENN